MHVLNSLHSPDSVKAIFQVLLGKIISMATGFKLPYKLLFLAAIVALALVLDIYLETTLHGNPYDARPLLGDPTLGVVGYYQGSMRNRVAASTALRLFRSVYPDAPLYIHYDGSRHDSQESWDMAVDFHATLVTYSDEPRDRSSKPIGMYFTVEAGKEYIRRLRAAALLQPRGWVLLLEDDVWTWSQVNRQSDLRYDICGHCWLKYSDNHSNIIRKHSARNNIMPYKNATCYGGSGGSFVSSSRLIGLNMSSPRIHSLLENLVENDMASDLLLCAVVLFDGGTIGWYKGYYDFVLVGFGYPRTFHHMNWLYFLKRWYG